MNLSIDTTPISLLLMIIIGAISFLGFRNEQLVKKTIFSPYRIDQTNEWYRFLTSGFIHADWMHLIFNMYVFAQFAGIIEQTFDNQLGAIYGKIATLSLFLIGVIVSHITGYFKHKNDPWYQSLGASGGVSSILFAFIFLYPTQKLQIMFIPVGIPAFLIGAGYLWYSNYLATKGSKDNVNHEAHYYGGVWGILFIILIQPSSYSHFVREIVHWVGDLL